jgi:hypothetical protein
MYSVILVNGITNEAAWLGKPEHLQLEACDQDMTRWGKTCI